MDSVLKLIGRDAELFDEDIKLHDKKIRELVKGSHFLVIGGAGSIGQAVVKEIFKRDPKVLHVVDISENNLVELVRVIFGARWAILRGIFRPSLSIAVR